MIYRFDCLICKDQEKTTTYLGETARTSYIRGLEHIGLMKNMSKESPMIEHPLESHQGQPVNFSMQVVRKIKRTLDRKVTEGTMIAESDPGTLINRKGEWGQNLPPKYGLLDVEDSSYGLKKKRDREEDELGKER